MVEMDSINEVVKRLVLLELLNKMVSVLEYS